MLRFLNSIIRLKTTLLLVFLVGVLGVNYYLLGVTKIGALLYDFDYMYMYEFWVSTLFLETGVG